MGKAVYGVMVAAVALLAVFSLYQLDQNYVLKSQIRLLEENATQSRILMDYYKDYAAKYFNLTLNSRTFNYTIEVSADTYAKPISEMFYVETTDVALLNVQLVPVDEVSKTNYAPSPDASLEPRYLPIYNEQGQVYGIIQTDAYYYWFYNGWNLVKNFSTVVIGETTHYITNYTYSGAMDITYYNVLNSTTFKVVDPNGWPLAKFYVKLPP